jgi:hypothetical protein
MIPLIFDDGNGIIVEFDFENGFSIRVAMGDDNAQQLVDLIQNKLNERFKR